MPVEPDDEDSPMPKRTTAEAVERNPVKFVDPGAEWEKYLTGTGIGREMAAWLIWGQLFLQPLGSTIRGPIVATAGLVFGVACIPIGIAVGVAGLLVGTGLKLVATATGKEDINLRANRVYNFGYNSFVDCQKHALVNITVSPVAFLRCVTNIPRLLGMYFHPTSGGTALDMPKTLSLGGLDRKLNLPSSFAYVVDQSTLERHQGGEIHNIVDFYRIEGKLSHGPGSKVAPVAHKELEDTTPIKLTSPSPAHVRTMAPSTPAGGPESPLSTETDPTTAYLDITKKPGPKA